jgi:hypothetical protein
MNTLDEAGEEVGSIHSQSGFTELFFQAI